MLAQALLPSFLLRLAADAPGRRRRVGGHFSYLGGAGCGVPKGTVPPALCDTLSTVYSIMFMVHTLTAYAHSLSFPILLMLAHLPNGVAVALGEQHARPNEGHGCGEPEAEAAACGAGGCVCATKAGADAGHCPSACGG